jgi:TldD protein
LFDSVPATSGIITAMSTSRRGFLVTGGTLSAGLLLPRDLWAGVPGARKPAPGVVPTAASPDPLAGSRIASEAKFAERAVAVATEAGASYADARLVLWKRERIVDRDDHDQQISRSEEYGLGVRVIADGAWGFAASEKVDAKEAVRLATLAVSTAKAHAKLRAEPVEWAPAPIARGTWVSPHRVDPFSIPAKDKAELLIAASQAAMGVAGVRFASAGVHCVREEKLFVSSEGARTHQLFFRVMPRLSATAVDRRRGRFSKRDHEIQPMLAGWEHVTDSDLVAAAPEIASDARMKLEAKSVEPGKRTVILAPTNLWLTIHESIGHPTELDRAIGLEANYAGTSFITPDQTNKLKFGSKLVRVAADRTQPGGLATTAWDDDGVGSQRWKIIDEGRFVGWQTTRDQAAWIGEKASRGCSYGDSYASVAFQRMPNISLQPGKDGHTTEDLINATDDGILISGRGSWSIDHQRHNFQFGGQFFWEIKNGRLTRPLRDVAYQAKTVDFWRSCDMIGGQGTYRLGGSFSDGKGEPGQSNAVSHGCPPARFEVNIVNTGGDR